MVDTDTDTGLDIAEYKAQTDDLIDSMDETTALFSQMADNMAQLSDSFENFGASERKTDPSARSKSSVAAD